MSWVAVGVSAVSAIGSSMLRSSAEAERVKAEKKRILAQKQAKFNKAKDQLTLDIQNSSNNDVNIKENKMKNDFMIEEGKLEASDDFAQAFAGSGISGRTKDAIEDDMESAVSKAHIESGKVATKESDRKFLGLMRSRDKLETSIDTLYDADVASTNQNLANMQAGIDVGGSIARGFVKNGNKFST